MTEAKKPLKKPRGKACLLEGKCIACGARCQSSCPVDAIVLGGPKSEAVRQEEKREAVDLYLTVLNSDSEWKAKSRASLMQTIPKLKELSEFVDEIANIRHDPRQRGVRLCH